MKPKLDRMRLSFLWKLLLFNLVIGLLYTLLIYLFGMNEIASEYADLGIAVVAVLIIMGNITFILLDRFFSKISHRKKQVKRTRH